MKKILITGGSGFIGNNLINYLIKKNYKIYNIDNLSNVSTTEKFKIFKSKKIYKFYKTNLLNKNKVKKIFFMIWFVKLIVFSDSVKKKLMKCSIS